ncbi:MAG: hypothetical protein ABWY00_10960 [Dongiaceae bacterium]
MTKAVMHLEPLERYLLSKIEARHPGTISQVKVRKLFLSRGGCNWDIDLISPSLPDEAVAEIEQMVVAPLKADIDLVD